MRLEVGAVMGFLRRFKTGGVVAVPDVRREGAANTRRFFTTVSTASKLNRPLHVVAVEHRTSSRLTNVFIFTGGAA